MRKETTYYAFDDTSFSTKEACEEYERKITEDYLSVVFFDENLKVIDLKKYKKLDDFEDAVASSFYIKIVNAEHAERFFSWLRLSIGMNFDGFPDEFEDGMWLAYDDENAYAWYDPVACMNYYANIVSKLKEVDGCP